MPHPAALLRARLTRPEILIVPGGGSPLELKLIEGAGFEAAYVSGYAAAAARHGVPDIGLIAYAEQAELVWATRQVTDLPLIVDCDTGYGDVANVARTVRGMEALGVAGVQIEDQAWPKKCGHMDGKVLEPEDVALRKLDAALTARRADTVVIARTDARGPHGMEAALSRCRKFRAAGADVLFVDGPESAEELRIIGRELDGPLMVNMSESGKTPLFSAVELEAMGFSIVIFPSSTVRIMVRQVSAFLADLKATGDSRSWLDRMASLSQTNAALGLSEIRAFEANILERQRS